MKGGDHLEDLGIDGVIILKWLLKNRMGQHGLDSLQSGYYNYYHHHYLLYAGYLYIYS
jgi:hypothetical protein